jgi:hypothetical protein
MHVDPARRTQVKPDFQRVQTHSNPGFTSFWLIRDARLAVLTVLTVLAVLTVPALPGCSLRVVPTGDDRSIPPAPAIPRAARPFCLVRTILIHWLWHRNG